MKHSLDRNLGEIPTAPKAARDYFGAQLPEVEKYARWLTGSGVERGIIGPRETERIWPRHLLNCAVLAEFVEPSSVVLDVGSGGGLPGIVLAIMRPMAEITLLEPMLRRTQFLQQVIDDLELPNVQVRRGRAEELAAQFPGSFDIVTARAVAPLDQLAEWAFPLLRPRGRLLALKGSKAGQELVDASRALDRLGISGRTVHELPVADTVTLVVDLRLDGTAHHTSTADPPRRTR